MKDYISERQKKLIIEEYLQRKWDQLMSGSRPRTIEYLLTEEYGDVEVRVEFYRNREKITPKHCETCGQVISVEQAQTSTKTTLSVSELNKRKLCFICHKRVHWGVDGCPVVEKGCFNGSYWKHYSC